MPSITELVDRFRTRGRTAKLSLRELAVAIVEGANHSDDAIAAACLEAGVGFEDFAEILATAQRRKDAFDAAHAIDFDAEIAKAKKAWKQSVEDGDSITAEIEALTRERRRLAEERETRRARISALEGKRRAAADTLKAALGEHARDWREF